MRISFTNRYGGMSEGVYATNNLGYHVNDNPLHVKHNRALLGLECQVEHVVFMEQVHGDSIVEITQENAMRTPLCDAMICNQKGIALAVMAADCIPILLYDPVNEAIGVAHAGRAGTLLHVGQKCIAQMVITYGSHTKDMHVWMGPSIRGCCYEVGKEATQGLESCMRWDGKRYFLDLVSFNKDAFLAIGVQEKNIVCSSECTCCDKDYFSYRRDKVTGRFAGVIWL